MPDAAPLNVLLLTPQLTRAAGGVWTYLDGLVGDGLPCTNVRPTIAGVADNDDWRSIRQAANAIVASPTLLGSRYGYSQRLSRKLRASGPFDVIHTQGVRTFIGRDALDLSRRAGVPLLISGHGMFHPQLRAGHSWQRSLIDWWSDRAFIAHATCFHATSDLERSQMRDAGIRQPIAVVPIGIAVPSAVARRPKSTRRVMFLGILNRKKGLPRLLEAWAKIDRTGWTLTIAGRDDRGHRAELEQQARALNVPVEFVGDVTSDSQRQALLNGADLFVLPTDWENFGIVVVEALASGVPVITTTGTPWRELATERCGWWIEPTVPAVAETLRQAMALADSDREAMGERGRSLVAARYGWPAIGQQMAKLYAWLAGRGERPAFVYDA